MADATPVKRKWAEVATVTLLVGEAKTAFHVHEADLFDASSFFKAAFTSEFRESSDRTMTLPEDDDSVFELFIDWLYRQRYEMTTLAVQGAADIYMQPVQLFALADKYDVPNLKSLILSQIFRRIKKECVGKRRMPKLRTVAYAYEHTAENSPMRKLLAGSLTCRPNHLQRASTQEWLRKHPDVSADVNVSFAQNTLEGGNHFDGQMPEDYMEKAEEAERNEEAGSEILPPRRLRSHARAVRRKGGVGGISSQRMNEKKEKGAAGSQFYSFWGEE